MSDVVLQSESLRSLAVGYARAFLGTPYRWGGDDPMSGFDCSGFVVEILQGVGILSLGRDYTAHDLMTIFKPAVVASGYAGCLAFWTDKQGRATHVMLMIDAEHVIGAAGGGSATVSVVDAIRENAYIKLRPLSYRRDAPIIIDPFKGGA